MDAKANEDHYTAYRRTKDDEAEDLRRMRRWMKEFKMTEEQTEDVKEAFGNFVSEGDSGLPVDQLGDALRALGQVPTVAEVKELQANCNVSELETISVDEFARVVSVFGIKDDIELQEKFEEALRIIDKEERGFVHAKELKRILKQYGEPLDDDDISEMVALAGVDGDGNINCFDLVRHICTK